jgi:hypothetical protein
MGTAGSITHAPAEREESRDYALPKGRGAGGFGLDSGHARSVVVLTSLRAARQTARARVGALAETSFA